MKNATTKTATDIEALVIECEAARAELPALQIEARTKAETLPVGRERNAILMQVGARLSRAQKALELSLGESMPEGWTETLEARCNAALAY